MSSLRHHAFVAVGSSWLVSLVGDIVRLVTMMVLARLLLPEDYGTFAMATAVTGWLAGVGFLNFSPNILREKAAPDEVATYLLFGLVLHGVLAVGGMGVAAILWYVADRPVVGALARGSARSGSGDRGHRPRRGSRCSVPHENDRWRDPAPFFRPPRAGGRARSRCR